MEKINMAMRRVDSPTKCENCRCRPVCTLLGRIREATGVLADLEELGINWELRINCDWYVGKEGIK